MTSMKRILRDVFSPLRPALPLLVLLPLLFGTAGHAKETPAEALGSDAISGALLRAQSGTLLVSDDGGGQWKQVPLPPAIEEGRIAAVAAAAKGKATWYIAGAGFGVLRTSNRGDTWEVRNEGLPSLDAAAVATHSSQPDTVYVYIRHKGIFRSEDGGKRWKLMDGGPREPLTQFIHSNMPGSMQSGWFFAATATGVARSMDCFCGWHDAGGLNAEVHAVAYDPEQPQRVYAATEKGLFVSPDGGEAWERIKSLEQIVTSLTVTASGALYVASGDRIFRSTDGARTWERLDG